ncbi:MAG: membrane protein insertion efficiency factor YidD [Azoarcus sp.]|nr:membrane protein insertion efficiency factor YidD [Azoarcus sp.]
MRALVLAAIRIYQRYLSPYKGFCCAYRHHTGRSSCSTLGFRAIRRYGVIDGIAVLRRRTYLCGVAHRRYDSMPRRPHRAQRGDCVPCDIAPDLPGDSNCDFPSDLNCDFLRGKSCGPFGNFLSYCDFFGCDWPNRKRKESEQHVHIPPNVGSKRSS